MSYSPPSHLTATFNPLHNPHSQLLQHTLTHCHTHFLTAQLYTQPRQFPRGITHSITPLSHITLTFLLIWKYNFHISHSYYYLTAHSMHNCYSSLSDFLSHPLSHKGFLQYILYTTKKPCSPHYHKHSISPTYAGSSKLHSYSHHPYNNHNNVTHVSHFFPYILLASYLI